MTINKLHRLYRVNLRHVLKLTPFYLGIKLNSRSMLALLLVNIFLLSVQSLVIGLNSCCHSLPLSVTLFTPLYILSGGEVKLFSYRPQIPNLPQSVLQSIQHNETIRSDEENCPKTLSVGGKGRKKPQEEQQRRVYSFRRISHISVNSISIYRENI